MNQNKEISGISCEVTSCKYHEKTNCCTAGKIQVGHTNAKHSEETACETFSPCSNCNS